MNLVTLNAAGKQTAPPIALDHRRRRLSQVIGRHVDRSRPFMVAVQRLSDPLQPIEEAWVKRGWKVRPVKDQKGKVIKPGIVKPWPRIYLPADAIVAVVYLPRGSGASASGGGSKKSGLSIALGIAAVALTAFAGPLCTAIAATAFGGSGAAFPSAGSTLSRKPIFKIFSRLGRRK